MTRILLLGGDPGEADRAGDALAAAGLAPSLERVATAAEFRAALDAGGHALVIVDLAGREAARASLATARTIRPEIPALLLADRPDEAIIAAVSEGPVGCVFRPLPGRLAEAVTGALAASAARAETARLERAREAERRALRERELRLGLLMKATASMLWTADSVGRFAVPQPGFEELTGSSFAQYRGWGWLGFIHPEDRDRMRDAWRAAAVSRTLLEIEHRVRLPDGSYRHLLTRGVPVLGAEIDGEPGRLLGWTGGSSDIETRKLAELALHQRIAELEAALRLRECGLG